MYDYDDWRTWSQKPIRPYVLNNNQERLRYEINKAYANGDYRYAALASQFLDTNYDDYIY
tara:strand:+ start:372 stop:551 length:180 start_codon:yes stop_codon:yes gene_type:complete